VLLKIGTISRDRRIWEVRFLLVVQGEPKYSKNSATIKVKCESYKDAGRDSGDEREGGGGGQYIDEVQNQKSDGRTQ